MKSFVTKAVTGLVAGAALLGAVASAAEARPWRGGGYGHHGGYGHYRGGGWGPGAAIGLGVLGLAAGAAIASDRNYDRGYYNRGYYYDVPPPPPPPPAYYGYGYGGYYAAPRGYYYGY